MAEEKADKQVSKSLGNPNIAEEGKQYQWKLGQSGNPRGRPPKDICITSLVKEFLAKEAQGGKTHAQLVAEAIVKLAEDYRFKGNVSAIKELLDRIEGKVPDTHKIESDIPISIVYKQVGDAIKQGEE